MNIRLHYLIKMLSLSFLCILTQCQEKNSESMVAYVPAVKVIQIQKERLSPPITYIGEISAKQEHRLSFQVPGKVKKCNVKVGDLVHIGQSLLELDERDLQLQVEGSKAAHIAASAQLQLASSEWERNKNLYEKGMLSLSAFQSARAAYRAAQAVVEQAESVYQVALNRNSYSQLKAERSGIVLSVDVKLDQVVAPGELALKMAALSDQEVVCYFPTERLEELKKPHQISIHMGQPLKHFKAIIREVSPTVDPVSGLKEVRLFLLPEEGESLDQPFFGRMVSVSVQVEHPEFHVVHLPLSSIDKADGAPKIWIVDQNENEAKVHSLTVHILGYHGENVHVDGSLFQNEAQTVVVAGIHLLREGQNVHIIKS